MFGCQGDFVAGLTWEDSKGTNAVLVTQELIKSEEGTRQIFVARRFLVLPEENMKQVWQHVDEANNMCDNGRGLVGDIELTDLNEDGVAEVTLVYNIEGSCDVSPSKYRLVLHTGLGIGTLEMTGLDKLDVNKGVPENGQVSRSPLLEEGASPFASFADSIWVDRIPTTLK